MKYALIGKKLGHSYSALIHKRRGLEYSITELKENEVAGFCAACARGEEIAGFNVTIPYKKTVIPFLKDCPPKRRRSAR